jgi:hypothetical protein
MRRPRDDEPTPFQYGFGFQFGGCLGQFAAIALVMFFFYLIAQF